jgi:Flp pilus assembly protein TadD
MRRTSEIDRANDLDRVGRFEEAERLLEKTARENPQDIRPLYTLANILRVRKRFAAAADYYTRAMALIGQPQERHWTYYYYRGVCYERLRNWPAAEADLRQALKLSPQQPLVLNYLGYTWIDQKQHMKEAMGMIEQAVKLRPDDGYVVDSLGWAFYRMGNFAEAIKHLERAAKLKPEEVDINEHLGDALWAAGRQREARLQWQRTLTLDPEPAMAANIERKLAQP